MFDLYVQMIISGFRFVDDACSWAGRQFSDDPVLKVDDPTADR